MLVVARSAGKEWEVTVKEHPGFFRGDENILKFIVIIVIQLCEYTENH